MRYNRYVDDFLIDKIKPVEVRADLASMSDLVNDKEWQIIDDNEHFWQEKHCMPEREMDLEQRKTENKEPMNLRILE